MKAQANGVSLWLMPTGAARGSLARLIRDVSGRVRAPIFDPHVTLVPGIEGDEERILRATAQLAASSRPLTIQLGRPGWRDEYFRCLFFEAERSAGLLNLERRARERLDLAPVTDYFPHLSLVYADLVESAKRALLPDLPERPPAVRVDAIHVYRTRGAVGNWRRLACFGFRSRAN